jgi:hypothetical protein
VYIGERCIHSGADYGVAKSRWLEAAKEPANDNYPVIFYENGREIARFGIFAGARGGETVTVFVGGVQAQSDFITHFAERCGREYDIRAEWHASPGKLEFVHPTEEELAILAGLCRQCDYTYHIAGTAKKRGIA